MKLGIIGLPSSGKTTIFNALTKGDAPTGQSMGGRFDVLTAVVDVLDPRVDILTTMFKPKKTTYARITYSDVAGLQKGGEEGSALGGAILNHLSALDGFVHVVRAFESDLVPHPDGSVKPFSLVRVSDRAGLYRASFDVERPGLYSAWIESEGRRVASAEFEVVLPSRENADPTPDPETMNAVASLTRGRALDLAHVRDLASEFPGGEEHREPISAELIDAWDRWATLLFALAVLSVEWVLRKRWEMV